jgi:hypothetical protein
MLSIKSALLLLLFLVFSCSPKTETKEEQIVINETEEQTEEESEKDSTINSIQGNVAWAQLLTAPNAVILTGQPEHRLVSVYKSREAAKAAAADAETNSSGYEENEYEGDRSEKVEHFMPGLDILYGYNLLNIAHYDMKSGQLNFLFKHPTLVKTLYYPSFEQDSLNKEPISRNYYLISAYDEDTNKDGLINRKDLRHFYHFDSSSTLKTVLLPPYYSTIRSQYDPQNDAMYIFAIQDANKNGQCEKKEPLHVFWIDLKAPAPAKRLY